MENTKLDTVKALRSGVMNVLSEQTCQHLSQWKLLLCDQSQVISHLFSCDYTFNWEIPWTGNSELESRYSSLRRLHKSKLPKFGALQ